MARSCLLGLDDRGHLRVELGQAFPLQLRQAARLWAAVPTAPGPLKAGA